MLPRLAAALLATGLLSTVIATRAADPPDFATKLDAELAAIVADPARPLASLSVLAIRGGEVVYHRQFGRRFIDPDRPANDRPADSKTLYRIASISKLVTTLGALRLVEEGKLSLDADIGPTLGFPFRNPKFPEVPVTLRMLLTHTSSLRDDGGYYWDSKKALKDVFTDRIWATNAAPGQYFQYANLPWGVIGTLMEKASGERFDRLMKRLVLDPMGLHGGFNPAEFSREDLANVATLYRKGKEDASEKMAWNTSGPWVAQVDDYSRAPPVPRADPDYEIGSNGTAYGPQGNIRLSAEGLGRIMRMLMNRGELDGRRVLKAETVDLMLSRQWSSDGVASGNADFGSHRDYFLAWGLGNQHFLDVAGPNRGDRLVEGGGFTGRGHLGDAWGLTSAFAFDPDKQRGLIFLAGGPGFDPATDPGTYSGRYRHEERILTALYRRAILGNAGPEAPRIVSVAEWGGTPADESRARRHAIQRITLHHEGVPHRPGRDPFEYLVSLQNWSRKIRNWIDVPYHYVVDLEGRIYVGRDIAFAGDTNTEYDPAGHALISVVGNFDDVEPNAAQLDAVARLMTFLAAKYKLPPESIRGHRDYANETTCPGKNLYKHLESGYFREQVRAKLGTDPH